MSAAGEPVTLRGLWQRHAPSVAPTSGLCRGSGHGSSRRRQPPALCPPSPRPPLRASAPPPVSVLCGAVRAAVTILRDLAVEIGLHGGRERIRPIGAGTSRGVTDSVTILHPCFVPIFYFSFTLVGVRPSTEYISFGKKRLQLSCQSVQNHPRKRTETLQGGSRVAAEYLAETLLHGPLRRKSPAFYGARG